RKVIVESNYLGAVVLRARFTIRMFSCVTSWPLANRRVATSSSLRVSASISGRLIFAIVTGWFFGFIVLILLQGRIVHVRHLRSSTASPYTKAAACENIAL